MVICPTAIAVNENRERKRRAAERAESEARFAELKSKYETELAERERRALIAESKYHTRNPELTNDQLGDKLLAELQATSNPYTETKVIIKLINQAKAGKIKKDELLNEFREIQADALAALKT